MQHVLSPRAPVLPVTRPAAIEPAIDLACALLAIIPLLLTAHIPLYDLPNHMAVLHVLLRSASDPALQQIYGVRWTFIPNMGLEVFTWVFAHLLSVEGAVRLFCIATVLLLCAGTRALSLALGRPNVRVYRLAPLLCWGAPLQFGFASYCFGIGLMLVGVALYVRLRLRPWPLLVTIFVPFSIVLLTTHLMAWGLFTVCLAGCEAADAWQRAATLRARAIWVCGRAALVASLTLTAAITLLAAHPLTSSASPSFSNAAKLSSPLFKAQSIAAITWFAMPAIEVPLLVAALCCLAVALWRRQVRPHPLMVGMVAALGVVWLILPRNVTASAYVDYRVPWAICFVGLAGLLPGAAAPRARAAEWRMMVGTLVVLVGIRIASISLRWLACEPELAAIDTALTALPAGTNLLVVEGTRPGKLMKTPPLEHVAAYLVLRHGGFESQIFAGAAGQMVFLQPKYRPFYHMEAAQDLLVLPGFYDAVLVLYPALVKRAPGLGLRQVAAGPHFQLFRRNGPPAT